MCICHWSARRWFDCAFQLNSFAGSPPPSPFMTQWWNRVHDEDEEKSAGSKPTLGNRSVNRVRLDSPRGCIWDHRGLGLALKTSTAFPQLVLMEGVWGIVPESLWGQSLPCVSPRSYSHLSLHFKMAAMRKCSPRHHHTWQCASRHNASWLYLMGTKWDGRGSGKVWTSAWVLTGIW